LSQSKSKMSDFKLSVIIPVYNQDNFLRGCLNSVVAQTLRGIEVIIVDDGSTDQSLHIAREFEERYSHFVVIAQKNMGRSAARNRGIDRACGEYIAFLDSDDFIDPDMYNQLFQLAVTENADLVKCGAIPFEDQTRKIIGIRRDFNTFTEITSNEELIKLYLNKEIDRVVWNGIYHRSLFKELRFPDHTNYEDQYVTPNVLANSSKSLFISQNLYYYRKHPGGFTSTNNVSDQIDKVQALNELYRILRNQKLKEDLGADYTRYFYKNVIGYHNSVIYRDPLTLKKNINSITNLIDTEVFEFILARKDLGLREIPFLKLIKSSHYLYFLIQKMFRIREMIFSREYSLKQKDENRFNSEILNQRYSEMVDKYA